MTFDPNLPDLKSMAADQVMGLDYANPPETKTHDILCSGGCGMVVGSAELHAEHPNPQRSTSGYYCEKCIVDWRKQNAATVHAAERREAALLALIDDYLKAHPEGKS